MTFAVACFALAAVGACGSRSALDAVEPLRDASADAPPDVHDAAPEAEAEAGLPLPWAAGGPADLTGCDANDPPVAYLVDMGKRLYTYDPPSGKQTLVGHLPCNVNDSASPYVMTVSRERVAYVLYDNGYLQPWEMFRLDIPTMQCQQVAFIAPGASDMGIAMSRADGLEWMFATDVDSTQVALYRADPSTFVFSKVGDVGDLDFPFDLQSDAYDRLFGYTNSGWVYQIDSTTGALVAKQQIPGVGTPKSWTLLAWGTSLYLFDGDGQSTAVRRLDLATHVVTVLPPILGSMSGASAPPCVP